MPKNLAEQSYWNESYANLDFPPLNTANPIARLILKYFAGTKGSVFEVGCFPGNFLPIFGLLGYELNGLDQAPRTDTDLAAWLRKSNFSVGELTRGDFLNFFSNKQYDVVCSFGFIEHFTDTKEIILAHDRFVKNGGRLILTTPNFRGAWQNYFHWFLDRENYQRHNIASMDQRLWKKILEEAGYEIEYCGWFGGFNFWVEEQDRYWLQKIILKILLKIFWLIRSLPWPNSEIYSPFCGLIARKK